MIAWAIRLRRIARTVWGALPVAIAVIYWASIATCFVVTFLALRDLDRRIDAANRELDRIYGPVSR